MSNLLGSMIELVIHIPELIQGWVRECAWTQGQDGGDVGTAFDSLLSKPRQKFFGIGPVDLIDRERTIRILAQGLAVSDLVDAPIPGSRRQDAFHQGGFSNRGSLSQLR